METRFYIKLTVKAINSFEQFGEFYLGNNLEFANDVFRKLKGNVEVNENNILQLDFIETRNNLPVNIKMIRCTLKEIGENCKIITREIFKFYNLKEI